MAVWLAERVGESGQVVATDIDVTYLKRLNLPNLDVRQHNILDDPLDGLGPGSFDLVCSRLLLYWLAGKQEATIRRMVECLRPGGWLVDEDALGHGYYSGSVSSALRFLPTRLARRQLVGIARV